MTLEFTYIIFIRRFISSHTRAAYLQRDMSKDKADMQSTIWRTLPTSNQWEPHPKPWETRQSAGFLGTCSRVAVLDPYTYFRCKREQYDIVGKIIMCRLLRMAYTGPGRVDDENTPSTTIYRPNNSSTRPKSCIRAEYMTHCACLAKCEMQELVVACTEYTLSIAGYARARDILHGLSHPSTHTECPDVGQYRTKVRFGQGQGQGSCWHAQYIE